MGNIYFDNKVELVIWGIGFVIIGSLAGALDRGLVTIVIFIWLGLGKFASKGIIKLINFIRNYDDY